MLVKNNFQNGYQKQKISFGTNLILGKGVIEHLKSNPNDIQEIAEFKDYLAGDGKDWNAELTYDTFEPKRNELEALIRKQAFEYDFDTKSFIEKSIEKMDAKEAASMLEKLSNDSMSAARNNAAEYIGFINDSEIAANLIRKLLNSENKEIGRYAARGIGDIKDPQIQSSLIEEFSQNQDSEIKESAIYAIRDIKDASLRNELIEKYSNSNEDVVKKAIARNLNKIENNQELFDKLLTKFAADENPEVREGSIGQMDCIEDEKYSKNSELYDSIIEKGLKDENDWVRRDASFSLGRLADKNKAVKLIYEMTKDEDEWTRSSAVGSLGHIKDSQVIISFLEKLLNTSNKPAIMGIDQILKYNQDSKLADYLLQKLPSNKDAEIRMLALDVVELLQDKQEQTNLINKFLKDDNYQNREMAARAIAHIKDVKLRDKFINECVKSDDLSIKLGLIKTLENISTDEPDKAKTFAAILAKDDDKMVQKKAKDVLDKIELYENSNHYSLKINNEQKEIGQRPIIQSFFSEKNIFKKLVNAYQTILEQQIP